LEIGPHAGGLAYARCGTAKPRGEKRLIPGKVQPGIDEIQRVADDRSTVWGAEPCGPPLLAIA
jgi:hypothetical protein